LRRSDVYYVDTLKQGHCYAQDSTEIAYFPYREQAEFKGGQSEMLRYLADNIVYPFVREGTEGKVFVSFGISKTGAVENVNIREHVDKDLDKEAIRVVKSMPNWKPGKQEGEPVRTKFILPIRFKFR
jgi:periplasmic protein TonB